MTAFWIQVLLNFAWAPLFFILRMTKVALVESILMEVFIWINIVLFYQESHTAAYLLIPYALWVCVAIYLNYHVVVHNVDPSEQPKPVKKQ